MGVLENNEQTFEDTLKAQINWFDDLLRFIYDLRESGFRVSLPQFIAAQKLLIALAAEGRLEHEHENLKSYLSPLFSFSPDEQQRFYHHFEGWIENRPAPRAGAVRAPQGEANEAGENQEEPPGDKKVAKKRKEKTVWKRRRALIAVASLILLLGLSAVIGIFLIPSKKDFSLSGAVRDVDSQQTISGAEINFENQIRATDTEGKFAFDYQSKPGEFKELLITHPDYESVRTLVKAADSPAPIEILLKRNPPTPAQTPPEQSPVLPPEQVSNYENIYSWLLIMAAALPFVAFGLWMVWRILWRRYIEKWRDRNKPDLKKLTVEQKENRLYRQADFLRVARELRRHRRITSNVLEPVPTIEATLRAGNFFTPVYGIRQLSPEYLVLIDRFSYTDQNAALADEIVNRLKKQGVFVDRFFFEDDPRSSWREGKNDKFYDLHDLAGQFPDHRLLIFSDGEEMIDPYTNHPQPWLEELFTWDVRLMLTTNAVHSFNEWILNHFGLPVLPAKEKELKQLLEIINVGELPHRKKSKEDDRRKATYPPTLREGFERWWLDSSDPDWKIRKRERSLDRLKRRLWWSKFYEVFRGDRSEILKERIRRKEITEFERVEMLRIELRLYLGAAGYELLCACAVYPEMLWDLTYYLAHRMIKAPDREAVLEAVVCLPWFRYGNMPDWLRNRLLASLPSEREVQIRRELEQLLISYLENPKRGFQLEVAPQEPSSAFSRLKKRVKEWFRKRLFYELIKTEPENSPLRDYVFLKFFSGGRLSVSLPRRLNRALLYGKDLAKNWLGKIGNLARRLTIGFFNFVKGFYRRGNPLLGASLLRLSPLPLLAALLGILALLLPASVFLVTGFPDEIAKKLPSVNFGLQPPFEIPTPEASTPTPVPSTPTPSTPRANTTFNGGVNINGNTDVNRKNPTPALTTSPLTTPTPRISPIVSPPLTTPVPTTPQISTPTPTITKTPQITCPSVSLDVSPNSVRAGESATLVTSVNVGSADLMYNYAISGGRLVGAGRRVTWDLSGLPPGTYTATVSVDSASGSPCVTTDTVTISVAGAPKEESKLVDDYANLLPGDEKARIDHLFIQLNNDPTASGYIIVYGSSSEASARMRNIRTHISFRKYDASRVTLVNGGQSRKGAQLWIVPAGADPP